jgi:hypothetical protein
VLTHFEKTAPRGEIVVVVEVKPIVKEAKEQILEKTKTKHNTNRYTFRIFYYQIKTKSQPNSDTMVAIEIVPPFSLPQLLITENNKMLQEKIQVL